MSKREIPETREIPKFPDALKPSKPWPRPDSPKDPARERPFRYPNTRKRSFERQSGPSLGAR